MGVIKMVLQAFALFAVPVILTLCGMFIGINNSKATSVDVIYAHTNAYGPFFVLTGLFYAAFGLFLWSGLPVRLLARLLSQHLN